MQNNYTLSDHLIALARDKGLKDPAVWAASVLAHASLRFDSTSRGLTLLHRPSCPFGVQDAPYEDLNAPGLTACIFYEDEYQDGRGSWHQEPALALVQLSGLHDPRLVQLLHAVYCDYSDRVSDLRVYHGTTDIHLRLLDQNGAVIPVGDVDNTLDPAQLDLSTHLDHDLYTLWSRDSLMGICPNADRMELYLAQFHTADHRAADLDQDGLEAYSAPKLVVRQGISNRPFCFLRDPSTSAWTARLLA